MCKSFNHKEKNIEKRYSNQITIKIIIKEDKRGKEGRKNCQTDRKQVRMAIVSPHLSTIALKHGLNSPIRRDRVDKEGEKKIQQ